MKSIIIKPPDKPVNVRVELPLSKSISNRMLVIGILAGDYDSVVIPDANDSILMKDLIGKIHKETVFDAQDAGTVFRFLTALLAIIPGERILTGTNRMMQRPVGPLVKALQQTGAEIKYLGSEGYPPLIIKGKEISGGKVAIDGSLSSQFISALMMIAPYMKEGLQIKLTGSSVSWPYIEMTARLMEQCGIKPEIDRSIISVTPGRYTLTHDLYEADWSAASYWFELVSLHEGSQVTLAGLNQTSVQGDSILTGLYEQVGVISSWQGNDLIISHNPFTPEKLELNMANTPDLVPALAVSCAARGIEARLTGLSGLTIKESNRLESITQNLRSLGFDCVISDNKALLITTKKNPVISNRINTFSDHRIAMAMSILSLHCGALIIDDMTVINKSYPGFWNHLEAAGFKIDYHS